MTENDPSYDDLKRRLAEAEADLATLRREKADMSGGSEKREEVSENLRESEAKYRALFENMNAGFVLFEVIPDSKGKPVDLLVLAANKGFEQTTGLDSKAVTGKRLTEALPGIENDEADWIGTYGEIALTGDSRKFEQGSELLGYYYSVIAYQAGPNRCAVTFLDVTERKKAEAERDKLQEQLLQAQKMESIGRLAGGVAHDFNNMLSIILGFGEHILEQLKPEDPLRQEVKQMVEAGRRSAVLTGQLLAFSRKQTLQPRVVSINDVVTNLEKMLRRLIREDIELGLQLTPDVPSVLVDPGQLEQVIMNLAVNARDAMPSGGKLLIETGLVELDRHYADIHRDVKPGKFVLLALSDTGCGMTEEVRKMVFEPFYTTKERDKGTGLGLAMVYGIVKQSGGNIWVYSEPDKGTTFKIYLPVTDRKPDVGRDTIVEAHSVGHGEHILVVEDEEMLRSFLEALLPRMGYKATVVANGGEALLMMEEKGFKPDLILTDVVMPRMSGKELVSRLERDHPDLKVIYMSGYTDNSVVHHGVLDPGTNFIQKPFTNKHLLGKLREVLGGDLN